MLVAAVFVPVESNPNGGYTLEGWLLAVCGVAVAVSAVGIGTPWARAAALSGLFIAASAAKLTLTTPHWLSSLDLRPAALVPAPAQISVLLLIVQALVVAILARRERHVLTAAARAVLTPATLAASGFIVAASFAHLSPFCGRPEQAHGGLVAWTALLAATSSLAGLAVLHLALIIRLVPVPALQAPADALRRLLSMPGQSRDTALDRRLPWLLSLLVFAATAFVSIWILDATPHIEDEVGYWFQAHHFARGALWVPAPPVPAAFEYYLFEVVDGKWFTALNPGWAALLSVGVIAGVPFLVNPLLAAVTVIVAHALTRRLSDTGSAHALTILLACSPWFLFISGSLMTQPLALLLALFAALQLMRSAGESTTPRAAAAVAATAGLAVGLLLLVRPLDALITAAVLATAALFSDRFRISRVSRLASIAGGLATSALLFAYNAVITGSALVFPVNAYFDKLWHPGANRFGFGANIGPDEDWGVLDPLFGHGPIDVVLNTNQNLATLNLELLGWPMGSLLIVALFLRHPRVRAADWGMLAVIATVIAAHSLYWFSGGPDYGPRYWYLALIPLLWLAVRGLQAGTEALEGAAPGGSWQMRVGAAAAVLVFCGSLTTFASWRAVGKYPHYRGYNSDYRGMIEQGDLGPALVLIHSRDEEDYGSALARNDPFLGAESPVFALDLGAETNEALIAAFPGREVVYVQGRSVTGSTAKRVDAPSLVTR